MFEPPESMLLKLSVMDARYKELDVAISDPDLFNNPDAAQAKLKEHGRLKTMVEGYRAYLQTVETLAEARELVAGDDPELKELAELELPELEESLERDSDHLRDLFVSADPESESDAIVEINAGVGGDEAALFAGDLVKMYSRLAERKGWRVDVLDTSHGKVGGFKRIAFAIEGRGVYKHMRFESGGHRVQRVPETESQGRIHTSMVTVVVLPQVEETDVEIDKNDVRVDKFCASGPGGQHVNKTESAIRLTHEPTSISVQCQDEKSQKKNLDKAWKVLRARVADHFKEIQEKERGDQRRSLRGHGTRNERIRTYNFPQDRCTDHRIGKSIHDLPKILEGAGQIDDLIEALIEHDKEESLKAL